MFKESEKLSKRDGQSIGAIVSDSCWKAHEGKLEDVELIPAFDYEELQLIRNSLRLKGVMGNGYDKLRPIQQRWLNVNHAGGNFYFDFGVASDYQKPFVTANPRWFEKTTCKTIALEIGKDYSAKGISPDSMYQLSRVLSYVHEQGGRRVILINKTSYTNEQLLIEIQKQSYFKREEIKSRLLLLLCETEDLIFQYDQFNGCIENVIPENILKHNTTSELGDNKNQFFSALSKKSLIFCDDVVKSNHKETEVVGEQHEMKSFLDNF